MITPEISSLQLRDITEISEMLAVERLQKEIWGIEDREIFPALALVPMIEVGGVLIGAFDEKGLAGFVFGFAGLENGKASLHSDMLAVRPEYRRHGLGYQLKLAQRERALEKGIDTITWTFDPLQARNARLNFGKLGVIADSYRINYYGETTSFLHQSGTDRLWVTWKLNSERVRDRVAGPRSDISRNDDVVNVVCVSENDEPLVFSIEEFVERNTGGTPVARDFAIEIPGDINRITERDATLTLRWREATRAAFTKLIDGGYRVSEFHFIDGPAGRVGRYLLTVRTTISD